MQASEDNQPYDSAEAVDRLGTSKDGSGGHVTDPKDSKGRCMSSEGLMVQDKRRGIEVHDGMDDQVCVARMHQVFINCVCVLADTVEAAGGS